MFPNTSSSFYCIFCKTEKIQDCAPLFVIHGNSFICQNPFNIGGYMCTQCFSERSEKNDPKPTECSIFNTTKTQTKGQK